MRGGAHAPQREADAHGREHDVGQHHQHQQGEDVLADGAAVQHDQEQRDLRDTLRREAHRRGEGGVDSRDVGAEEGRADLARERDEGQRQDRLQGQLGKVQAEVETRGGEEQRDEEALGGAAHAGHDVAPHLVRQEGEGGPEEERAQGAVQPHLFGGDDDEEEAAEEHAEGELRHVQQPVHETEEMRQQLAGHEPRDDGEPEDLGDDDGHLHRVEAAAVLVRREALADGEAYDEEGDQLDDDDGGEYLHADGLAQPALVDERLRDDAQAGEGEHAGEAEGLREAEAQLEVEEVIGRDCEGDQHRERHGEHGGEEDPAADGGDEAADVQLLHPDEEEEHEDADAEDELDFPCRCGRGR